MNGQAILESTRRFLVIAGFSIWMGGLSFYGLIVVPTGTAMLGSTQQGFITRQVTESLNLIGCAALAVLLWDAVCERRKSLIGGWIALAALQATLMAIHPQLDRMLDPSDLQILDESRFHPLHELYLTITGVQWTIALAYLALTLCFWRTERPSKELAQS